MKFYFWIPIFFIISGLGKYVFLPATLNCSANRLNGLSLLIVVFAVLFLAKRGFTNNRAKFFLSAVAAGGLSNLVEKTSVSCISDYLNFFGLFRFNLADVFVCAGLFMFGILIVRDNI